MKGIVITTSKKISIMDFDEPLYKSIGEAVGGYIEIVHPMRLADTDLIMIVNKEGRLNHLPVNSLGSYLYGVDLHGEVIVGDIVIMSEGYNFDGEFDILGIPDDRVSWLFNFFKSFWDLEESQGEK